MVARSGEALQSGNVPGGRRGPPGLMTILLVALIVLPLLALLIIYRDNIAKRTAEIWDDVMGKGEFSNVKTPSK